LIDSDAAVNSWGVGQVVVSHRLHDISEFNVVGNAVNVESAIEDGLCMFIKIIRSNKRLKLLRGVLAQIKKSTHKRNDRQTVCRLFSSGRPYLLITQKTRKHTKEAPPQWRQEWCDMNVPNDRFALFLYYYRLK